MVENSTVSLSCPNDYVSINLFRKIGPTEYFISSLFKKSYCVVLPNLKCKKLDGHISRFEVTHAKICCISMSFAKPFSSLQGINNGNSRKYQLLVGIIFMSALHISNSGFSLALAPLFIQLL